MIEKKSNKRKTKRVERWVRGSRRREMVEGETIEESDIVKE